MKTYALKVLETKLFEVQKYIDDHHDSLMCVLKYPSMFHKDAHEVLRDKLSVSNKEKLQLLDCIDWVKSVQTKDVLKTRTK